MLGVGTHLTYFNLDSNPDLCGNMIKFHSVPDPGHVRYRGTYFSFQSFVFSFGQMLCRRARGPEREQSYFELACGRVQHGGQPGGGGGGGFATSSPCQETRLETSLFEDLLFSSHCALPAFEFSILNIFGPMPASFRWTDITKLGRVSNYLHLLIKKKRIKFSSSIRVFRRDRLQNHTRLTASSYMVRYLRISSYIGKPFLI